MLSPKKYVKNIKPILNTKLLYQNNTQKSNQNKKLKEQHNYLPWIIKILSDYNLYYRFNYFISKCYD